jgi:hypothetical protein
MPTLTNAWFFLLMLGGLLWMGQFVWFPGGGSLVGLLVHNERPPTQAEEIWAIELYRATFSPDCGARWVQSLMVVIAWISWLALMGLAVLGTLSVGGLLPKGPVMAWVLMAAFLIWTVSTIALPILLMVETILLWRQGVSLGFRARRTHWIASHPAPKYHWSTGKMPWWFWLDSGGFETLLRLAVFLGGFLASVAAIFYFSHTSDPKMITAEGFWNILSLWVIAIIWLAIPITIGLSHLDWTHRDREVLLLWAGKQR